MSELEPSDYSARIAEQLRALGVEAVLIGALAALRYRATPRFTTDVDFLASSLAGVAEAMAADGYEVRALQEGDDEPYAIFIRGKGIKVDLLRAETDFQRSALDRACDGVITAEDVIVFKLVAWRARDRDDVASILESGIGLDTAYIERWAEQWEVADRWAEAIRRRE